MMNKKLGLAVGTALLMMGASQLAQAACSDIPRDSLLTAMGAAKAASTGGYGLDMWATVVDETGKICQVATTGTRGTAAGNNEWLGSRIISAQKANTANAFSLNGYAISTANLYTPVQPGNSLYGLQHSNPIDASRAYGGDPTNNGTWADFLKNKRIGGVNVFGGGLALYKNGVKVGAVGVSGDTSCRDHAFAWVIRSTLGMEPAGVGITTANLLPGGGAPTTLPGTVGDEMIFGTGTQDSGYWSAWAHPGCPNTVTGVWSVAAP
ncbi:glycolate utilization protein [Novimethylophilus kurashikiensis]|uniref:Glycolate utilization protein n=1 Tax=Novimethylophilus kurashikiensis TaxID=1825523 RepID=A0A2R5FC76_9PROT|nr:heme-binding protein [Novimethylophilus kurashikiensis]GBG15158.1 glycolate utilization protein [Novimethylophilus kurashikiensis]